MMNNPLSPHRLLQRKIWKAKMMYDIGELSIEEYASFLRNQVYVQ